MTNLHNWETGSLVVGRLAPRTSTPPVIYMVIHRTKHFVTLQKQNDPFCIHRKRPSLLITGKWGVILNGVAFTELPS